MPHQLKLAASQRHGWPAQRPTMPHPSKRAQLTRSASLLGLAGVLDGLKGCELDIVELAVDLLDPADIDILNDVARRRVDRDRAARALPFHCLHGVDQLVAIRAAAGVFQRLIN